MNTYLFLKYFHILAAITGLGSNISYGLWLFVGKKQQEHLLFVLQGIKKLDDWVANPSYVISLVTGLAMAHSANMPIFKTTWLLCSLFLFGLMGILGFGLYSPLLAKQIRLLSSGNDASEYEKLDKRAGILGLLLLVLALIVVYLMVTKPN